MQGKVRQQDYRMNRYKILEIPGWKEDHRAGKERRQAMQLGGIGIEHSADMHQITRCAHDHAHSAKAGAAASASSVSGQILQAETQTEAQFSLSAWLEKTLGSGKRMLGSIWGSSETGIPGENAGPQGMVQGLSQETGGSAGADAAGQGSHQPDSSRVLHAPQIAAAASAVPDPQTLHRDPYFSAVEDTGRQQETLWQKMRVKFNEVTGQLSGHLQRKFFSFQAKSSFEEKQERPRENLRRQNRRRRDTVELGSARMDDNYLLDSYDRKGGYSRLSTKK